MCYDCDPQNLVGKVVQGVGTGRFQDVRNSEEDFYLVEGVTFIEKGKLYNFTLKAIDCFYQFDENIRHVRRGTFYNHFKHVNKVPQKVLDRVKRNMEQYSEQVQVRKQILKMVKAES